MIAAAAEIPASVIAGAGLLLVAGVAALLGFLEYRERVEQRARNEAADAKLKEKHAEAERDAAIADEDDLTKQLRADLDASTSRRRDGES